MSKTLQTRASINKLIFMAMTELMCNSYLNTKVVVGFDGMLMNKLNNLKPSLERKLKEDVAYIESHGGTEVIQLYHELTQCFEDILATAQRGDAAYFEKLIRILRAYHLDEIEVYNSVEEIPEYEGPKKRTESPAVCS